MTEGGRSLRMVHPVPGLRWTECRDAATECAGHGWSVLPGTYEFGERGSWFGKTGAMGLEPVFALWATKPVTDVAVAMERWTQRPYSVLLACGQRWMPSKSVPTTAGARWVS